MPNYEYHYLLILLESGFGIVLEYAIDFSDFNSKS